MPLSSPSHLTRTSAPLVARVILPLALEEEYSYLVPSEWQQQISVGMRALVQFGSKRYYYAIVSELVADSQEDDRKYKYIISLPDATPLVSPREIALWRWGAEYYMAKVGSFLLASIPSHYRPTSESEVQWNVEREDEEYTPTELSEQIRTELLRMPRHKAKLSKLAQRLGQKIYPEVARLLKEDILISSETIARSGAGVYMGEAAVGLPMELQTDDAVQTALNSLRRAPAQQAIVETMLHLLFDHDLPLGTFLPKQRLTQGDINKQAALRTLIRRGLLIEGYTLSDPLVSSTASPRSETPAPKSVLPMLSDKRPNIFIAADHRQQIEVVYETIEQTIEQTPSAIIVVLVPQLFLLEQSRMYRALQQMQQVDLLICGSSTSPASRIAIRHRLLGHTPSPHATIILSTRIGALLPLDLCSLVIVTDEESNRYKQSEPTPRYHARDLLVVASKMSGTPLLLITVAPSAEAVFNVHRGNYRLLSEPMQIDQARSPRTVSLVDLSEQRASHKLPWGQAISIELRTALLEKYQAGGKSLLLLNRRGYAPHVVCRYCGETMKCPNCDVGLVYHKSTGSLHCSYCNYATHLPQVCPSCRQGASGDGEPPFKVQGYGIERISEELLNFLPSDSTIIEISPSTYYNKEQLATIRRLMHEASPVVFVGTTGMVYLDAIRDVQLIGMVSVEQLIVGDDFRSNERAYAAIERIGRCYPDADLFVQSYTPRMPLIESICTGVSPLSYSSIELAEREYLHFPPFVRLIYIYVKGSSEGDVCLTAATISRLLQDDRYRDLWQAFDPVKPFVSWVRLRHIRYICTKIKIEAPWRVVRQVINGILQGVQAQSVQARRLQIYCDVDPL